MRITTYNVNGINGRLANVLAWLGEAVPDIACLQELRAPNDKFPAAALRKVGYGAIWHGEKSWNGVCDPRAHVIVGGVVIEFCGHQLDARRFSRLRGALRKVSKLCARHISELHANHSRARGG